MSRHIEFWNFGFALSMYGRAGCIVSTEDDNTIKGTEMFGLEFILDLKDCSTDKFNREGLTQYFEELCDLVDMKREDLYFWDYDDEVEKAESPIHLDGTSAIQFITTSNITIHTLDKAGEIMINLFSCKAFNHGKVRAFTMKFFDGNIQNEAVVHRGTKSKCKNL